VDRVAPDLVFVAVTVRVRQGASERDRRRMDGRVDVGIGLRASMRVLGVGLRVRMRVGWENKVLDRKVGEARLVETPLARGWELAFGFTLQAAIARITSEALHGLRQRLVICSMEQLDSP
jgi:hypothetical protein